MAAPLRGTQSLVGQMGWVFQRPSLTLIEVGWRWLFGVPLLVVCWLQAQQILTALPPESSGLATLDLQNPWVAAVQLSNAWALYQPHVATVLRWLLPVAALAWVIVSGLGRNLLLKRLEPSLAASLPFRPVRMIALQAAWLAFFFFACWGWLRSMQWVAATHITIAAEPDLIGFSMWAIFLSLTFFTAWALTSWAFSIAPLLMLLEHCGAAQALARSLRLGKLMTAKLIEINLVMGIVNLALIVLAMVLSAAPLPFSDQLGSDTLHWISAIAVIFYLVASDYFQVVRLKGFHEFWKMFRG
ncbi:MAG: hypothetical protein WAK26_15745 [Terracidiphilus sp.]